MTHQQSAPPLVSVVVAMLNEEGHIGRCIHSILDQTYPADLIEVVVVDGGSTDRSAQIVKALADSNPRIRLVDNPKRLPAAGFNAGIRWSHGEVVTLASAHSQFQPDYVTTCVELLTATGADNVGGRPAAYGIGTFGKAVAAAYGSPFGVGNARHHFSDRAGPANTVFPGCFRRDLFDRIGFFDETLRIHEDYEFNARIRAAGGVVYYSPRISTGYQVRETPGTLTRQYFAYGRGKAAVTRHRPEVMRPHHFAPPALVAGLTITAALSPLSQSSRRAFLVLAGMYAMFLAAGSATTGRNLRPAERARLPLALATMHLAWGAGFLLQTIGAARGYRPLKDRIE